MEKWTSVAVRRNRLVLQSAAPGIETASRWRTLTTGRNRQCVCVLKIPLVLLSVIHVVCRVVDKGGLRRADVSLTSSLKKKEPRDLKCLFQFWRLKRFSFTSEVARCLPLSRPFSLVLCTCAIIKACRSCPLPVKKETSFFMSPVATQYGMASSLSSAISWSARLRVNASSTKHQVQMAACYISLVGNGSLKWMDIWFWWQIPRLHCLATVFHSVVEKWKVKMKVVLNSCSVGLHTQQSDRLPLKKKKQCLLATKAL